MLCDHSFQTMLCDHSLRPVAFLLQQDEELFMGIMTIKSTNVYLHHFFHKTDMRNRVSFLCQNFLKMMNL